MALGPPDMDKQSIIDALRNTAQSASNTVSEGVSVPVDLLASLLRKAGIPVPEDAVGSSRWMAEMGITRPVGPGAEKMIGETLALTMQPAIAAKFAAMPKVGR